MRQLTGVALPIKVVLGVAVALQVQSQLLAGGAVREGDVVVGNLVEEVDFFLLEQQTRGDGVDGGIAPSFVEEAAVSVQRLEVVDVFLGSQPVQASDFEVRPLSSSLIKTPQSRGLGMLTKWHLL